MGTARIKYSSETRKLRVYHPDSPEPNFWGGIGMFRLAGRAWFLKINAGLEEQLGLLQVEPKSPYDVQEISFLLRRLKGFSPVLAIDLPGWRNHRENPRAEWLRALKELDESLAQRVREFISGEGKREYLR